MKNFFNLKTFFTFLSKNKLYTAIEVFGLSVSLMFVVLIAIYTAQELSVDQFHTKADRIFIIGSEESPATGAAIAYKLKERYPEIEKVCPVVPYGYYGPISTHKQKLNTHITYADSTFFEIFSFPLIAGNPSEVLDINNNVVLSDKMATILFEDEDPIGKHIILFDSISYTVSGIFKNNVSSSLIVHDIILPWRNIRLTNPRLSEFDLSNSGSTIAYILAHKGANFQSKAEDIKEWFTSFFWIYKRDLAKEVRIESLNDFYKSGWGDGSMLRKGDKSFITILASIGFLILVFAVLNYINLSVAQAGYRYKEMAMRRLLGSNREGIFSRLIIESIIIVLISVPLGIIFAFIAKPFANNLLKTNLNFLTLTSPTSLLIIVGVISTIGFLAGWIPAFMNSRIEPIEIVRGTFRRKTKMIFSKVFISFQNFITACMLTISLIIIFQINHLTEAPLGFNTNNILELFIADIHNKYPVLEESLLKLPCVKRIGHINEGLLDHANSQASVFSNGLETKNITFNHYGMDKTSFEILGLELLKDNQIGEDGFFINKEALRQMNLTDSSDYFMIDNKRIRIAGVINDFYRQNILNEVSPILFRFLKPEDKSWTALIEVEGNPLKAQKEINSVYEKIIGSERSGAFMDKKIEDSFQSQIRLAKIVSVFTAIAIIISLLGLIAMSTYFIQQRQREVAVRKVFGSTNDSILTKLVFTFLKYTLVAFIASIPVVVYVMNKWLADYSYRITIQPWIFIAVGLFCTLIALLAVGVQSWKAANSNPIKSLKQE